MISNTSDKPVPPTNKGRRLPPEPLTRDEIDRLIAAASGRSTTGIRSRALIAIMAGAGLRLSEALALYPRDLDLASGTVRVRHGKGNKDRAVGILPWAVPHLERWLDRRGQYGLNGRHLVFSQYSAGKVGQPIDPRYVRLLLTRLATRAGIDKRVHPHGLRHSLATDLAWRGVPLPLVAAQLGHATVATTDRYLRKLAPTEVVAAMQALD